MEFLVFDCSYRRAIRKTRNYINKNNKTGKIGEVIVWDNITNLLINKGYEFSCNTSNPNTYRMIYQYRRNARKKRGGIDIYLTITTASGIKHRAMIEVSNWMKMHDINDYIWNKRIVNKFKDHDKLNRCVHVVMMNYRNIHLLQERAEKENILLIPLPEHYTFDFLGRIKARDGFVTMKIYQKVSYLLQDIPI